MAFAVVKEYLRPKSHSEVVELLTAYGNKALLLGGGTFLHGLAARGLLRKVDALIDLQNLGLSFVKSADATLTIGAMTTFAELEEATAVQNLAAWGAVQDALQQIPAQIKNMATVGGCIASGSPLFDLPVAFLALEGAVKAVGPRGSRVIELRTFFRDYFEHALEKNEFLTEVLLPVLPAQSPSAFRRLETTADDVALLNVGVSITVDKSGICQECRVALGGGVGKVPLRAASCEAILKRNKLTEQLLNQAADAVSSALQPISDHRASAHYRTAMAKVFVRRALERAVARLGKEFSKEGTP